MPAMQNQLLPPSSPRSPGNDLCPARPPMRAAFKLWFADASCGFAHSGGEQAGRRPATASRLRRCGLLLDVYRVPVMPWD